MVDQLSQDVTPRLGVMSVDNGTLLGFRGGNVSRETYYIVACGNMAWRVLALCGVFGFFFLSGLFPVGDQASPLL